MEANQQKVCYTFLKELDHELGTRVAGLEASVNEYNALLHRLQRFNQQSSPAQSTAPPVPPPTPPPNVSAAARKGDELDSILEQARSIRLKDDKPKARATAAPAPTRTAKQPNRAPVKGTSSEMASRAGASGAKRDKGGSKEADLDRILEVARGIRRKDKDNGDMTSAKLKDVPSSVSAHAEAVDVPPAAPPAQEERPLVKIDGHRVEKLFAGMWATDRAVYASEARVLSEGAGCQVFPRSVPYLSLRAAMAPTAMPAPPTAALTEGRGEGRGTPPGRLKENRSRCYDALSAALKENRMKYIKHMKRLLREGEKVSHIGPADKEELFSCWYEHQALLELYEILRLDRITPVDKSVSIIDSGGGGMSCELRTALDTIRALPKAAPLDFRASAAAFLESSWLDSALREIDLFNESLKTRTKYAVETVIARTVLKECIHSLKQCTIRSRQGEDSEALRNDWVLALRQYRSVWSCLTRETKGAGTVSFVYR